MSILEKFGLYLHQLTHNAFLKLSVFIWTCKSMCVNPTAKHFLRTHIIHHQPKKVTRPEANNVPFRVELQYGCINFWYKEDVEIPATAYKKRWEDLWINHWFYHTIEVDEATKTHPLVYKEFGNLPEERPVQVEDTESSRLFKVAFGELAMKYGIRDLLEEYRGCDVFPLTTGWSIVAWSNFENPIKIPDFEKSFGKTSADIDVDEIEACANIVLGPEDHLGYALI
ncbi:unnamed protein product [Urochloa humidicola]